MSVGSIASTMSRERGNDRSSVGACTLLLELELRSCTGALQPSATVTNTGASDEADRRAEEAGTDAGVEAVSGAADECLPPRSLLVLLVLLDLLRRLATLVLVRRLE